MDEQRRLLKINTAAVARKKAVSNKQSDSSGVSAHGDEEMSEGMKRPERRSGGQVMMLPTSTDLR